MSERLDPVSRLEGRALTLPLLEGDARCHGGEALGDRCILPACHSENWPCHYERGGCVPDVRR